MVANAEIKSWVEARGQDRSGKRWQKSIRWDDRLFEQLREWGKSGQVVEVFATDQKSGSIRSCCKVAGVSSRGDGTMEWWVSINGAKVFGAVVVDQSVRVV